MSAGLPRDPVMLLSVVNTKLRDYYSTLDVLCEDMQVDKQELIGKLEMIDYTYDAGSNPVSYTHLTLPTNSLV